MQEEFQFTPPTRVVTREMLDKLEAEEISIHTTHTGGDFVITLWYNKYRHFNPHHPHGW